MVGIGFLLPGKLMSVLSKFLATWLSNRCVDFPRIRSSAVKMCLALLIAATGFLQGTIHASVVERTAKSTLTPVELDHGDELRFTLRNGETRVLRLDDSGARVLLSNVYPEVLMQERIDHGIHYKIWIDVTVDGEPLRLTRYLCSQASFNEPYVVNGMRVWLDYIRAPSGDFMRGPVGPFPSNRGGYPEKEARIVVNDLTDRICPQVMEPWYRDSSVTEAKEFARNLIDARDTYKGDDMHMGGYWGATPHRGLDINMRVGTQLMAPIDFDTHQLPSGSSAWRGERNWGNGSSWQLRAHHTVRTVVPEHAPLAKGTYYADAAGVNVGEIEHAHFEFRITEHGQTHHVDAWILFWQMFRDRNDSIGAIKAKMSPLSPAVAGEPVAFSSEGSRARHGDSLRYSWTFGDGGASVDANPTHTYLKPGIYAVTLTVEDDYERADFVQLITVSGDAVQLPGLALDAPDEVEFGPWPVNATRTFGAAPAFLPHSLNFTARASRPQPAPKEVVLVNNGGGSLDASWHETTTEIQYEDAADWCFVELVEAEGRWLLEVSTDATGMPPGDYHAVVEVIVPGAENSPQRFRVRLDMTDLPPPRGTVVMTNECRGFYATPWFWVPHSFHVSETPGGFASAGRWDRPLRPPALLTPEGRNRMGISDLYLSNGYRAEPGQFFRFRPDLAAGTYEISTPEETPWDADTEVDVRIRHAGGDTWLRYQPGVDPVLGTFVFDEGRDGFVEFHAEDSVGQLSADAVIFTSGEAPERAPGKVAHWIFGDYPGEGIRMGAVDSVRAKTLEFSNMAGDERTWVKGRVGDWALRFESEGGIALAGSLGLPPGRSRTIAAWIRADELPQEPSSHVVGFRGTSTSSAFRIAVSDSGDRLVLDTNGRSWNINARGNMGTEWNHVAVTWDGSSIERYLNGVRVSRSVYSPFGLAVVDDFAVGSTGAGTFEGAVDDIRVYDRALALGEIRDIFEADPRAVLPPWRRTLESVLGGDTRPMGRWLHSPVGLVREIAFPWIEHRDLGWIHLEIDEDGLWFWSQRRGWVWTDPGEVFPALWVAADDTWWYIMHELTVAGWAFDFESGAWDRW